MQNTVGTGEGVFGEEIGGGGALPQQCDGVGVRRGVDGRGQPLAAVLLAQALQKHINIAIGIPISTFLIAMIFNILTLMGVPSGTFQEFLLGVIVVVFGITAQRNVKGVVK